MKTEIDSKKIGELTIEFVNRLVDQNYQIKGYLSVPRKYSPAVVPITVPCSKIDSPQW